MSFRFRWELSPQDIERADHYAVEGYKNAEKMGAKDFTIPADKDRTHKMGARGEIWGRQGKRPEWERDKDHPISSVFFVPPTVLKQSRFIH